MGGWNVVSDMKIRNCCLNNHWLFFYVYIFRFVWWRFLFTHVTNFLVLQWNSTVSTTTSNDVINVKPNLGCCLFVFFICFLVRKIDIWTFGTKWKCMIRLRICAHCSLYHIRCFGINMTPMWHHCIFICFIYVIWFFTRPSTLSILAFIFDFFQNTYHARIAMMNVYF